MATTDFFLKFEGYSGSSGITGESADASHKGEIEIESFSWGAHQTLNIGSSSSGAGAGRVDMLEASFVARSSSATPSMFQACCSGVAYQSVTLSIRKAGGTQQEYLKVIFKLVAFADFRHIGVTGVDLIPRDEFRLAYGGVQINYSTQTSNGALSSPIKKGWDFTLNKII